MYFLRASRTKSFFLIFGLALLPVVAPAVDLLVYNTNNVGPGSLRQAISDNNALGGGNTIVFSNIVTGTITLSGGELLVTRDVTINGPGDTLLSLSGNNANRIFHLTNAAVHISGLTITDGLASRGGGIMQDSGTLLLRQCVISNSSSSSFGGGIAASGTVALAECVIVQNRGFSSDGVGMAQIAGSLTVSNCTFLRNTNTFGRGGAIEVLFATATIINCSFASNHADFGGAIINYGTLGITNCTISANTGGSGGGIHSVGTTTVRNTIVAGNTAAGAARDCSGAFNSGGYNLIGSGDGSTGWIGLGDQVGSTNAPLNPLLGPLQNNGGSTPTMAPLVGSPAIDQANNLNILTDQRGRSRPYDNPAIINAVGGNGGDIGAVELNYFPSIVVSNTYDRGDGSLRQAVAEVSSNGVIAFATGVTGTIGLVTGEIEAFHRGFSLVGPGAKILTVSNGLSSRIFSLFDGTFNISGLTLAKGVNTGQNAGRAGNVVISYPSVVNFQQCRITGWRSLEGAGIWNAGVLTLSGCTLDNNFATNYGGGIFNFSLGSLSMTNCTIAANTAFSGSGLYNEGTAVARNCTFAFNIGFNNAGGVASVAGTFNLAGCLIASNTAPTAPDVDGPFVSGGYNLIGKTNNSTGFGFAGDQFNINPEIGPLADYGGPTPTIALRVGSPAIDKGNSFGLTTDQRGFARTLDDPSAPNANDGTDVGSFEVDPNFRIVALRRVGSDVALSLMTVLGRNYGAEYKNDLASGAWTPFTNNAPGNGYLLWVTNSGGANQLQRFYRAAIIP